MKKTALTATTSPNKNPLKLLICFTAKMSVKIALDTNLVKKQVCNTIGLIFNN